MSLSLSCEPVDQTVGAEPGDERWGAVDRKRNDGLTNRDPAHVVKADDREREYDPVPECVHDAADLDEPDHARQVRV